MALTIFFGGIDFRANISRSKFLVFHNTKFCKSLKVTFEGIRGSGDRGDIAIDDFSLNEGSCPLGQSYFFDIKTDIRNNNKVPNVSN